MTTPDERAHDEMANPVDTPSPEEDMVGPTSPVIPRVLIFFDYA